jgi:large subunit ribosomal protein L21
VVFSSAHAKNPEFGGEKRGAGLNFLASHTSVNTLAFALAWDPHHFCQPTQLFQSTEFSTQRPTPSASRSRHRSETAENLHFPTQLGENQPASQPASQPAMSRALLRSVLELRAPITRLLPIRPTTTATASVATSAVRFFNQTTQIIEPVQPDPTVLITNQTKASSTQPTPASSSAQQPQDLATPKPLSESVRALLPLLAAQPGHYITIHIHGRPYLVTEGDSVRLPFKMPGVTPGDILRLNRASVLGSRGFTLQGAPYVDERLFECRAVVTGTESEPLRIKLKKKRRCRRMQQVKSKHRYTILRISELRVQTEVAEEN